MPAPSARPRPVPIKAVDSRPPFRTERVSRKPILSRLFYGMLYRSEAEEIPTVPMQIRISRFQDILTHRFQDSIYIPLEFATKRFPVVGPLGGPTAKVPHVIATAPPHNIRPQMSRRGGRGLVGTKSQGTMNARPRFTKATRAKFYPYKARTY